MYRQEKSYLVLVKESSLWEQKEEGTAGFAGEQRIKKIADAGLLKITLTEQKIRVDYHLNQLPICYGISMECRLKYRQQEETTTTRIWRENLVKGNSHYTFQMTLNKPVETIFDCSLHLQGGYLLVSEERLLEEREFSDREKREEYSKISGSEEENLDTREIQYIRDLEYLRTRGDGIADLYYNSFLLHGFYQHHYFILGKDFIGVPDHFCEREAIAAKMMGFSYFIEGDKVENCNMNGEVRKELPKVGSFGYFLKKLS